MRAVARVIAAEREGRVSLIVDLANEPIGRRWFRGVATLALLCGTALALAPGLHPFATPASAQPVPIGSKFQMNAMLSAGPAEEVGVDVAAAEAPVTPQDTKPLVASTDSAIRVQGSVTEGLYWSLREAGVPSAVAAEYLQAVSKRIDVGADVAPFDRFDLVVSRGAQPQLLVAALHRFQGEDVQLMKWTSGGRTDWFDGDAGQRRSDALMAPVAGRITSRFGMRYHPILRFGRMHSGVDFGASWGSPIVAAADGEVIGAGWNGGYGKQVRVAHESGVVTTYSHMSGITAEPGESVRQGQVIGYVGSTGLSTGPHLHFEVHASGRKVDPLAVRLATAPVMSGPELQAFKARLKALLSIGAKA